MVIPNFLTVSDGGRVIFFNSLMLTYEGEVVVFNSLMPNNRDDWIGKY